MVHHVIDNPRRFFAYHSLFLLLFQASYFARRVCEIPSTQRGSWLHRHTGAERPLGAFIPHRPLFAVFESFSPTGG